MIGERAKVKAILDDNGCHTGTTVCGRHAHAVSDGIYDARTIPDRRINLACDDIFALPTEGVADPVDKMKIALASIRIRSPVRNQVSPFSKTSHKIFFSVSRESVYPSNLPHLPLHCRFDLSPRQSRPPHKRYIDHDRREARRPALRPPL